MAYDLGVSGKCGACLTREKSKAPNQQPKSDSEIICKLCLNSQRRSEAILSSTQLLCNTCQLPFLELPDTKKSAEVE